MNSKKPGDSTQPIAPFGTSPNLKEPAVPGPTDPYLGLTIKERYRIERHLGQGGIGAVYLAHDLQLHDRPVVIKVLLAESEASMHNPWFRQKFEQEIEALVRLDHPGIVGVLDAGAAPDGKPFFVMQYVEGANLRALVRSERLAFSQVAEVIRQLGAALTSIHEKGIIHRDLKPENIMVQRREENELFVKIIDFGIASVKDSRVAATSEKTKVVGALPYMAPEQLRGTPEPASDIWALGVLAYELLTGRLPFSAETILHLYEMQRAGVSVAPRQLRAEIPVAAEEAILKALNFAPADRYARARDLGEALARALIREEQRLKKETPMGDSFEAEIAHVLFMDLVGYSILPSGVQVGRLGDLREIVRQTSAFQRAKDRDQLLSLPLGDGMALVFFGDPAASVECAIEIARELKSRPELPLRIGLHSGPVYRVSDINTNLNVAGGGINLAQRVMDCGDAGHILLSGAVADIMRELGPWTHALDDLGEHEVKHGLRIHLYNLYTTDVGNTELPERLRLARARQLPPAPIASIEPRGASSSGPRKMLIAGSGVLIALMLFAWAIWRWRSDGPAGNPSQITQPAAARTIVPLLSYSITARRNPRKYPREQARELAGEIIFTPGDELRVNLIGRQSGYFYIINEGPQPRDGLPSYNLLFPAPDVASDGKPLLAADQRLYLPSERPPWFQVDNIPGTEKLWLIWAERSVPELERVRKWLSPEFGGKINARDETISVQEYLDRNYQTAKPVAEKDEHHVNLKGGQNGLLIYLLKLEHL
jgi:serine/threonine protein kinase